MPGVFFKGLPTQCRSLTANSPKMIVFGRPNTFAPLETLWVTTFQGRHHSMFQLWEWRAGPVEKLIMVQWKIGTLNERKLIFQSINTPENPWMKINPVKQQMIFHISSSKIHTWNLQITPFRKENDLNQTSTIMFHVNLQWCNWKETNLVDGFNPFGKY